MVPRTPLSCGVVCTVPATRHSNSPLCALMTIVLSVDSRTSPVMSYASIGGAGLKQAAASNATRAINCLTTPGMVQCDRPGDAQVIPNSMRCKNALVLTCSPDLNGQSCWPRTVLP